MGCVPPKFNRDELKGGWWGGGGEGVWEGKAFINIGSPSNHIRRGGKHSGFVCSSRLRFGRIFLWCLLLRDTFWLLTDEEVIFILGRCTTWELLGEQGFAVCYYQ